MRTSNPVFRSLENTQTYDESLAGSATYRGITAKTLTLLLTMVASGFLFIYGLISGFIPEESLFGFLIGALIVGFISVLIGSRSVNMAMPFGIIYAIAEGILLGTITALIGAAMGEWNIPITALIGTAAIFTVMLFLYSSRIIRVTPRMRRLLYSILLGALVFMMIYGILLWVNPSFMVSVYSPGLALGITAVLIVLGAFMLTLDFERAEAIISGGYDKRYEWVVSIGLMVTLVWIYVELLRFLLILASRNR